MRILVVGAGAVGGYFGGRLLAAGRDVTFLVRSRRAAELKRTGLVIRSPRGDVEIAAPPTVTSEALSGPYDVVLLSCKAYDLESAADSFAPAVGPQTAILPLLNGMRHLDHLIARFGAANVLGGLCQISSSLDSEGRILHLMDMHVLAFGERNGGRSPRAEQIASAFSGAGFDSRLSEMILQEMWEKWVFIAAGAGITCLMRASIGDIVGSGAGDLSASLYHECAAIASREGFQPRPPAVERSMGLLTSPASGLMASMLRDIERGGRIEADHVVGDLLQRAAEPSPLLRIANAHLAAYEARRARQAS